MPYAMMSRSRMICVLFALRSVTSEAMPNGLTLHQPGNTPPPPPPPPLGIGLEIRDHPSWGHHLYCKLCWKCVDDNHLGSKEHLKRKARFEVRPWCLTCNNYVCSCPPIRQPNQPPTPMRTQMPVRVLTPMETQMPVVGPPTLMQWPTPMQTQMPAEVPLPTPMQTQMQMQLQLLPTMPPPYCHPAPPPPLPLPPPAAFVPSYPRTLWDFNPMYAAPEQLGSGHLPAFPPAQLAAQDTTIHTVPTAPLLPPGLAITRPMTADAFTQTTGVLHFRMNSNSGSPSNSRGSPSHHTLSGSGGSSTAFYSNHRSYGSRSLTGSGSPKSTSSGAPSGYVMM